MNGLLSAGVVIISRQGDYILVEIGRTKKTKRFYLTHAEASSLLSQLEKFLS